MDNQQGRPQKGYEVMPVCITGGKPAKYRPNAKTISNEEIRKIAPEIFARQKQGELTARDLADSLGQSGVLRICGRKWNATSVYHVLKRGKALGLPFIVRGPSQAASERRVIRRPKCVIEAERAAGLRVLLLNLATKTAMIAASSTDPQE